MLFPRLFRLSALLAFLPSFGCGGSDPTTESGSAAATGSDNNFQVIGKVGIDRRADIALGAGKVAAVTLPVGSADPVSIVVKAADGDVDLQLFGLFDDATGKFGTLRAESRLVPNLAPHLFGFTPLASDVGGNYMALVSEKSGRAIPFSITYGSATGNPDFRFTVNAKLRGEANKDPTAARASFDAVCEAWKTDMLRLALANVELLDCGSPRQAFDGRPFEAGTTMVVAAAGEASSAPRRTEIAQITGGSVDEWRKACLDALTEAKTANGDSFLAGSCGRFDAVEVTVAGGVHTEAITSTPEFFLKP